jgi:hypothetical protein
MSVCLPGCLSIYFYLYLLHILSYLCIYVSMYLSNYNIYISIHMSMTSWGKTQRYQFLEISSPASVESPPWDPWPHLVGHDTWAAESPINPHQSPSTLGKQGGLMGIDGDWTGPNITIQIIPWVPIFSISGATQQHHNVVLPPAVHFAAPPRLLRPSHLQRMPPRPPGSICLVGIQRAALEPWEQCTQIGHIGCLRDEYPMAVSNNMAQIWKLMINRY